MKSRQKGKKKGCSKERVFGCDLQEHLQHSGQDGKGTNRSRGKLGGCMDRHADTKLVFSGLIWSVGKNQLLGPSGPGSPSMRPVYRQDRKCGSEKAERLASVIVRGQIAETGARVGSPREQDAGR